MCSLKANTTVKLMKFLTANGQFPLETFIVKLTDAKLSLEFKWDEKAYRKLNETLNLAEEQGHIFEELLMLLFANKLLRTVYSSDVDLIINQAKLKLLDRFFDMEEDQFRTYFQNHYLTRLKRSELKRTELYFKTIFTELNSLAKFFSGNLDFTNSQLCFKAMLKTAPFFKSITPDMVIETLFSRAVDYGYIRDLPSAFKYYNKAIEKARDAGDRTYLYIAIQRKVSICIGISQLDSQTDFDLERIDCIRQLNDMLTDTLTNAEALGHALINEETERLKAASSVNKSYYIKRINDLKEAVPMMSALLSLSNGDFVTARKHLDALREAENSSYSGAGYSENLEYLYSMLYNSPEREEYEENKPAEEIPEDDAVALFDDEYSPAQKFIMSLANIRNCLNSGLFKSAEEYCKYNLRLAARTTSDYYLALAINSYGQLYEKKQEYDKATVKYQEALAILENADLRFSDADLSPFLYYNLLCETGRLQINSAPDKAIEAFTKADEWLEKHSMPQMLFKFQILNGRADAYEAVGKQDLADNDRIEFLRSAQEETKRRILYLDSDSRDIFWNDTSRLINLTIAHLTSESSPSFRTAAYNAVLLSKGILLSSEQTVKRTVEQNPELKPLFDELTEYEHNRKEWGTSSPDGEEEYTEKYLKSVKLINELRTLLRGKHDLQFVEYEDILSSLKEDDVIIDYFDYDIEDKDRQYIAFVLKKGDETPSVVKLCTESELNGFFEKNMEKDDSGKEVSFSVIYDPISDESQELFGLIWNKVEKVSKISQDNNVYFVPSGSLHKISVESLPSSTKPDTTLCDSYHSFSRMSHARMLFTESSRGRDKKIIIFGDIDYGSESPVKSGGSTKGYKVTLSETAEDSESWNQLPWTNMEVKDIQSIFSLAGWTAEAITGKDASVTAFKKMDGAGPAVLHISTHGFALNRRSAAKIPALNTFHHPLDLTGFILAEGNKGWTKGNRTSHEGVMLASELSSMDLTRTEIAFVSCCFSGEGIVRPDGIYGIQRALKMAGVRSIIMSLWAEDDEAGSLFAREFYLSYLSDGDCRNAFVKARQKVRKTFIDPYYWACWALLD